MNIAQSHMSYSLSYSTHVASATKTNLYSIDFIEVVFPHVTKLFHP